MPWRDALGGMVLGAWGFTMLNAFGAVLVLAPLASMWLTAPAEDRARA